MWALRREMDALMARCHKEKMIAGVMISVSHDSRPTRLGRIRHGVVIFGAHSCVIQLLHGP